MLSSVLSLVAAFLASWLTYQMSTKSSANQLQALRDLLDDQRKQNQELLNRIQAEDIHTFKALQHSVKLDDKPAMYYPRSDEAEALQAQTLYSDYGVEAWGLGETLIQNDDEFQDTMKELGLWEPEPDV